MGSNIDVSSTGSLVNRLMNPPNPMEQLGQTIQGVNALKSFQANQASADAYRQSVDPQTGEVDLGKYKALLSQGPGAWLFGPQTEQAGRAVGAVGQGTTADVQSKMAQLGAVGQFLTPLAQRIANGEHISGSEAQAQLDQAHSMGLVNDQLYARVAGQISQIPPGGNADGIIRGAVIGNDAAMHSMAPNYQGAGGYIFQTQPFARGGNPAAGPVVTTTMTPDTAGQLVPVQLGGNQTAQMPLGEAIRFLHNNPQYQQLNPDITAPPGGGGGGAGGAQPGRYPKPPQQQPQPPAAGPDWAQPPPPNPSAGGVGVTPRRGYEKTADASTDAANALQAQITQAQDIKPTLSDMESNIRQGATTGVGAQQLSGLRQALINFGLTPDRSAGDNPNQASAQAAQEEFNKNAALLQGYQLGALGRPTDARQELSEASRPGGAISAQGNLNLIHMLQGNQQAIEVVGKAWAQAQKAGWSPDRFNEWANDHFYTSSDAATGGKFNRRVFWMANAPDLKAQQEIYKAIPDNQKEQFKKDLRYAGSQGWVTQDADGSYRPGSP